MSAAPTGFFVTGTDTGIGKTRVALVLMARLRRAGLRVLGMKPVATGCEYVDDRFQNDDALRLLRAGSLEVPYRWVNPYAFGPPISPNIAAELSGRRIDFDVIIATYRRLKGYCEAVIVEGVGGWEVPLNGQQRVSDLAQTLRLPVVLVVGLRLGCLNHAILSERAILASGVPYRGWCVNAFCPDFAHADANIRTLQGCLAGAFLGAIPYRPETPGTLDHEGLGAWLAL